MRSPSASTTLQLVLLVYITFCVMVLTTAQSMMNDKEKQKKYLEKFNHLGAMNPDPRMAELRQSNPDEEFREAVKSFQRFAGLDMTGVVDQATADKMDSNRCGVADLQNNMGGVSRRRRKRYTVQGSKWNKNELTYKILNSSSSLTLAQVQPVIQRAMDVWSAEVPLTFRQIDLSNRVAIPDIEIYFASGDHGDRSPFDGQGTTLAHAYFPGLGIGGDMHFDNAEPFTINAKTGTNLFQVAVHELGHSLGLAHSDNQKAIMAPFYKNDLEEKDVKLHMDDVNGIKYIYGSKPAETRTTARPTARPAPATNPPPGQVDTPVNFCLRSTFDAIEVIDGVIHGFYGSQYVELEASGAIRPGFPKLISGRFPGVPDNLDAVLSLQRFDGTVYFFKGGDFWLYNRTQPNHMQKFSIQQKFGVINKVDAAFVWGGNGYAYVFSGDSYYRYSTYSRYLFRTPRLISEWKLPGSADDAFQHPNGKTYFVIGRKYHLYNDMAFKVESSEEIYEWMRCCNVRLGAYQSNAPLVTSTSFLVFVGSLFAFYAF